MPYFPYTAYTGGGLTYVRPPAPLAAEAPTAIEDVVREATAMDRWLPAPSRVRDLTDRLRDFIGQAAPALEAAAGQRDANDPARRDALAAAKEARYRLRIGPGNGYASAITFARSLGRAAETLLQCRRQLEAIVPVAGTSGYAVIVVTDAETCDVCVEFGRARHAAELRYDWSGMKRANTLLGAHRRDVHPTR
ncbi:DUF6415 family natural product biosynthesis protein [Streptomyces blastmyceticus]|uniref:Aldehyde dehydrogenase domain-containing protein n=1 Tax=Streptomyces blastmyceticus TaxID=68180 RepID=A0ABN0WKD7_9ACTN